MMRGLGGNQSPKRLPLGDSGYPSPYGRPSIDAQNSNRRYTNKY